MIWIPKEFWEGQDLSRLPVGIAGDVAFKIFCTPILSHYRASNHTQLVARARFHLRNALWERVPTPVATIQTYTFAPDRDVPLGTVLVVHGWTGEASFMTAVAEPIRRAGYRVRVGRSASARSQRCKVHKPDRLRTRDGLCRRAFRSADRRRRTFVRRDDLARRGGGAFANAI